MPVQLVSIVGGLVVLLLVWRLVSSWFKYRGQRVVICPENQRPAGVVLDAGHAALTALGKPPERTACLLFPLAGARRLRATVPRANRGLAGRLPGPQHPREMVRGQRLRQLRPSVRRDRVDRS